MSTNPCPTPQAQAHELLLQVLLDLKIESGQVVQAISSDGTYGKRSPERLANSKAYFRNNLPEAGGGLIEDYFKQNDEPRPLIDLYGCIDLLRIIEKEELTTAFSNGWEGFDKKFPDSNGYLQISATGFSSDRNQALICIGQQVGPLAGCGICHLYERKDSRWVRVNSIRVWVS